MAPFPTCLLLALQLLLSQLCRAQLPYKTEPLDDYKASKEEWRLFLK